MVNLICANWAEVKPAADVPTKTFPVAPVVPAPIVPVHPVMVSVFAAVHDKALLAAKERV